MKMEEVIYEIIFQPLKLPPHFLNAITYLVTVGAL